MREANAVHAEPGTGRFVYFQHWILKVKEHLPALDRYEDARSQYNAFVLERRDMKANRGQYAKKDYDEVGTRLLAMAGTLSELRSVAKLTRGGHLSEYIAHIVKTELPEETWNQLVEQARALRERNPYSIPSRAMAPKEREAA